MYLSRVEFNRYRRGTLDALTNLQVLHAAVENSFPATACTDEGGEYLSSDKKRNLWRTDLFQNSLFLLVVSSQKPDFTHIVEQFGWPASHQEWVTKDYRPFLAQVQNGQLWRFRLCANTTFSKASPADSASRRGQIQACNTVDGQKKWLVERAGKHGFAVREENFIIAGKDTKKFGRKKTGLENRQVTLSIAVFEGILEVTDDQMLRDCLCQGLGRAKAYGCGLMTLARL
jgi:CRISPR system Cascade subunit CasE